MTRWFWNFDQHRLHTFWRLWINFSLFLTLILCYEIVTHSAGSSPANAVIGSILYLCGGLGLAWLMSRFIDRRSFKDYGFHLNQQWGTDLLFGLFLGAFLLSGIFLTEITAGWVSVSSINLTTSPLPFWLAFPGSVFGFTAVGVNEELVFRGYQIKNLAEAASGLKRGPRVAIASAFLISSALFGLAHMGNENATPVSSFNLFLGGILLGLPFLLSGDLALSIGLHISWNLFEGTIYGFSVSGMQPATHLLVIQQSGPTLWTGGAFGPEAGLLSIIWTLVGCGLVLIWFKSRRRLELALPLTVYSPSDSRD